MDDLDRLYRRLVLTVRDGAPHLLDRQFRLGDVAAHLVPYRHTRRELGFDSVQQYEAALMRLAAGERGYLLAGAELQDALRQSLAGGRADGELLRAHADAPVALPPDALARAGLDGERTAADAPREAAPEPPPITGSAATPADGRATPQPTAPGYPMSDHPPARGVEDLERAMVASSHAVDAWSDLARSGPAAATPVAPTADAAAQSPEGAGAPCRYCGQPLPDGRRITFCPYCGNNVTVLRCPACSTELDVGWRYCITCGRAMDETVLGGAHGAGGGPPGAAGGR